MLYRPLAGLIFATSLLLQSSSAFANDQAQQATPDPTAVINAIDLDPDQKEFYAFIDELYKDDEYSRPASCPLEPKGHEDLVNKIKSIELLLNNECLGTEVSTVEKILAGTQGIKDELNKVTNPDGTTNADAASTIDGAEVSNYLSALNSINNLYIKMKCEGQRMSFLNKTAEFISGIAQLGLLSTNPNGIIIAAAGSAISAILNIIDDLFSKQYEFKYEDERMAFVKINCAFRDLRRDLQKSGLLNTGDVVHRRYAVKVNDLISTLQKKVTELASAKTEIEKPLKADQQAEIGQDVANIEELKAKLTELATILASEVKEDDIKKRQTMAQLYRFSQQFGAIENNGNRFSQNLDSYFFSNDQILNNVLIFPENFLDSELSYFIAIDAAALRERVNTISAKDFAAKAKSVSGYIPFIIEDLNQLKAKIESDYQEQTRESLENATANEVIASANTLITTKKAAFDGQLGRLTQIKNRLDNVLMDEKIIASDNGSLNVVTIMEKYITVEEKFYGKLGKQFMDYIIDEGVDSLKDFEGKMKKFYDNHTIDVEKAYTTDNQGQQVFDYNFIDDSKYSYEQKKRACQDLRPYLVRFTLSKALMNAGYDYIWTNRDLFHSDYARKLFRLFGLFSGEPQKYLQYHEKSATRANTLINGGSLSQEDFDKYIMGEGLSFNKTKIKKGNEAICRIGGNQKNRFPSKASKKRRRSESSNSDADVRDNLSHHVKNLLNSDRRTQGMLMMLVNEYRPDAEFLSLIDTSFKCEKILSDEGISAAALNGSATEGVQIDRTEWQSSIRN